LDEGEGPDLMHFPTLPTFQVALQLSHISEKKFRQHHSLRILSTILAQQAGHPYRQPQKLVIENCPSQDAPIF
jgi:hypothetical protein